LAIKWIARVFYLRYDVKKGEIMKRILSIFAGILFAIGLTSCAIQYDINSPKKLSFNKPDNWKRIESADDYTYDYAFRFQNQDKVFEVFLRTIYVPGKKAADWLISQQKEKYSKNDIVTFSTKNFKWYFLETDDSILSEGKRIPIKIRQYVAKEEKSPRLIQCYLAGTKESFADLKGDGGVGGFLDSIKLEEADKLKKEDDEYYKNYYISVEEMKLVNKGEDYYKNGNYDQAIRLFESFLKRELTRKLQADLCYYLSECYLERGIPVYVENKDMRDFQEAIDYAKKAVKLQKNYWPAYFNIGIAYMNMGEYGQAKGFLKKALKYCGKDNPGYLLLRFHYEEAKSPLSYKSSSPLPFVRQKKIEGIMYEAKDPIVMISGEYYRLGQTVNGHDIIKITDNKVYLKFGHRLDEFVMGNMIPELIKTEK
jgi:tetratricopeptide (TPR) repeat protein